MPTFRCGMQLLQEERTFEEIVFKTEKRDKRVQCSTGTRRIPGVATVEVEIQNEKQRNLKLFVVSDVDNNTPLFGRQWLRHFFQGRITDILKVNSVNFSNDSNNHALGSLLKKYSILFDDSCLGEIKGEPVSIQLKEGAKPTFLRARPVPFALRDKVGRELDRLERQGILLKVDYSEFATPIVAVPKPNGEVRICGDFKVSLNSQIIVDEHPLPTTEELFSGLAGGEKFSKIDLKCAYLQWKVREQDQKYLTLNTHKGLYKCTRLMYGLNCAPAKWQRKIENILKGIPGIAVFIDDIQITAENDKVHLERLELVFSRLAEYGLKINLTKSSFLQKEIEYCGYKISKLGIHKLPSKIDAIQKAPPPKNITELKSFLGLVNYYGRFLGNLATTLEPLHKLLRLETKWEWTIDCDIAFKKIKKEMQSDTFLVHYSTKLPIILATDASPIGVGAVISHVMPDGTERPIQMASQTLSKTQRKWSQIDKEAYAIIFGVKKFFQYLYGRKFTLLSDNKPLVQIFAPNKPLPHMSAIRMQHYAIFLQTFNYEIKYKSSKENSNADGLSRLPIQMKETNLCEESDIIEINQITTLPITVQELAAETCNDVQLKILLENLLLGKKLSPKDRFNIDQSEFSVQSGCIMRGQRVVIPVNLRKRVLHDLHSGHFGINKMILLARSFCWWPEIDNDIKLMVDNCIACCKQKNNPKQVEKHHWEYPSEPFERVHIDFAGKFLGKYFLLLIDAYSKWPEIYIINKIDTDSTIKTLDEIFSRFGYPKVLVSDNGTQFVNPKFAAFLKQRGIFHKRSAPYNPATNGQAERHVQILKNKLRSLKANDNNIHEKLNHFLHQYRITPHTTTKKSPADLLFSYKVRSRLSLLLPKPNVNNGQNNYNVLRKLQVGDRVIARNYSDREKWKFGTILNKLGSLHYTVELDSGERWRRHINQIRGVGSQIPKQQFRLINDYDYNISNDNCPSSSFIYKPTDCNSEERVEATNDKVESTNNNSANVEANNQNFDNTSDDHSDNCIAQPSVLGGRDESQIPLLNDEGRNNTESEAVPLRRSTRIKRKVVKLNL
ncbi:uncharacterized protein K02A2.6-like [Ostrinia nubilalis]|uniref:uncharacterized protein K02A2.6-like n=1 Tax=Ostrinia nubilalis TaxID=29057 RepID=UPI00308253D8